MAVVVVGGQARKVGKTSVIVAIIAALADAEWIAIKVTQHPHTLEAGQEFALIEEHRKSGSKDTSRYLAAGAKRAFLLRTKPGSLAQAMPQLQRVLGSAKNVVIESNSVIEFIRPDVYLLLVGDGGDVDVKESVLRYAAKADAVLRAGAGDRLRDAVAQLIEGKPVFAVPPPEYVSSKLIEFVRQRIAG